MTTRKRAVPLIMRAAAAASYMTGANLVVAGGL